jgi:hypothetical protein
VIETKESLKGIEKEILTADETFYARELGMMREDALLKFGMKYRVIGYNGHLIGLFENATKGGFDIAHNEIEFSLIK